VLSLVLALHEADGALEFLAASEELAVERRGWQAGDEPVGDVDHVAETRPHLLPVPIAAHAVELLAHPPAGRVVLDFPLVSEEERRLLTARSFFALFTRSGGFRGSTNGSRRRGADAFGLESVVAIGVEMLARAALDRSALIAPRRARAGIHP